MFFALVSAASLTVYTPVFYKNIANGFAQPYSDETLAMMLDNFWMVVMFYAAIWVSWRLLEVGIIPLEAGGIKTLESRCFEVLKQQKFDFFENQFSGSLIKQVGRFSRAFEVVFDWLMFQFLMNVLTISIAFVLFYQQQPEFAFYFLIWIVLFITWIVGYAMWKLRFDKRVAERDSKLGGAYSDAISNIFIVKAFALEQVEQANIDSKAHATYVAKRTAWALMFVSFAVQALMTMGIELLLVYLMIDKWKAGEFEVGEFVLFQSILLILVQRLWEFGRTFRNFFTAIADATEMAAIFKIADVEKDRASAKPLKISQGAITFEKIYFDYMSRQNKAATATVSNAKNETVNKTQQSVESASGLFADFSLHIKAGEKIALVGESGSGKTSLTKLLFRFLEPERGHIYFDGQDANDFTLASLRNQISLVPQQPELFHRSVYENIVLNAEVSREQVIEAARKANSLSFIEKLPDQFDTLVGERGVKLSGGEKQRIALARAFLEDAPIVILDEATSALDSITETHIQKAIFELIEDKTAIVIAHRLSTVLRMDRILVLEAGRIIEEGSHQSLLDQNGKYATMWKHQSGEFLRNSGGE